MNPNSWLAPPATTSPSALMQKRPKLLSARRLQGAEGPFDLVVIGSGLAGLTAANRMARLGHRVLVLEQHYNFGGLATWFKRSNGHVFDISLHGFPAGMIKTCKKYWSRDIADAIVQLERIRFDNPQFQIETTFDREDFTRILTERFRVPEETVTEFFETLRRMNFYDEDRTTTRELFERFFPGRNDVHRLLMEPIAYANGSTLDDPAITYGIVFSNFMSKGVFTFHGGTDQLIKRMKEELKKNGAVVRNYAQVERVHVGSDRHGRRVEGVRVNGVDIEARAVVSNANLWTTIFKLVGESRFDADFVEEARQIRMNNASSQVYVGLRKDVKLPSVGDLLFTSSHPVFDTDALTALECTSRTYSFYYPELRPTVDRSSVVASINSNYEDWADMDEATYQATKERYAQEAIEGLERYVPGVSSMVEHVEVATPKTFEFFTQHHRATSFGTKFEGLKVSQDLPKQIRGLFHAGSVGIIMSGWLGAANYGVIVANEADKYLDALRRAEEDKAACDSTSTASA